MQKRIALILLLLISASNAEQIPGTDLSVNFESANIIGSGRTINIYRLPIINSGTNETQYIDASLALTVENDGTIVFDNIRNVSISEQLPSAVTNIETGSYIDLTGNSYEIIEDGVIDGRTYMRIKELDDSTPYEGLWVTGSNIDNPLEIFSSSVEQNLPTNRVHGKASANSGGHPGFGSYISRFALQQMQEQLIFISLGSDSNEYGRIILTKQ